ncbi:MAG: sulfur oxidation c-type cytochrome SoxA [Thiomargarita sp.]|nr:sulfur oxidation c-type cytochrome SoxA [Thiomargarita sp.]
MKNIYILLKILLIFIGICLLNFKLYAAEISLIVPLEIDKPAHKTPWKRYSSWNQTDWKNFNNLRNSASPEISKYQANIKIEGNSERGRKLVTDRKQGGNCVACHVLPKVSLPGNVGPNLSTVRIWERSDDYLFNYIYDPRQFNANTIMPPWGAHKILTKQQIQDIIAYFKTLSNTDSQFKTSFDNPKTRSLPTNSRDNLDVFENPAMLSVEFGEELFNKMANNKQSCQSCHTDDNVSQSLSSWAATMPKFETRLNKIIGIEEFITRHARATMEIDYPMQSQKNLALSVYLRYLANGKAIQIDQNDENTKLAIERGKSLMNRRIGQFDQACVSCHANSANKWIRGQYLMSREKMYGHFPTYRTSRGEIWDIRKRFQWCGVAIRANELSPDAPEYGDLEIYLAILNNGQILSVPGIRH